MAVALHDRLVKPKHRSRLRRRALRSLVPWIARGSVSILRGKRVLEARPSRAWNKGTAVSMLLRRPWVLHRVPVYFGDDQTDFDAFSVIQGRGFATRVGGRRGVAGEDAWIPHPKNLHSFWTGWQQGDRVEKLASRDDFGVTCGTVSANAVFRKQTIMSVLSHSWSIM